MDWGKGGYNSGRGEPPDLASRGISVAAYGAVGNGSSNDTAAFVAAIAAVNALPHPRVLFVPAGRFTLYGRFALNGILVTGAGPGQTVLHLASSLVDTNGPISISQSIGTYTYGSVALLSWSAIDTVPDLSRSVGIVANATKGSMTLRVSGNVTFLTAGRQYRLVMDDVPGTIPAVNGTLLKDLYGNVQTPGSVLSPGTLTSKIVRWVFVLLGSRTDASGAAWIHLSAPLPFNVSTAWNPRLADMGATSNTSLHAQGIENLSIEFPLSTWTAGYEKYNAMYFWQVSNAWVRNVVITNADNGITTSSCTALSVINVTFTASGARGASLADLNGTAALRVNCNQCVFRNITFAGQWATEINIYTGTYLPLGNVFSSVTSANLAVMFSNGMYASLFSNVNAGLGTRMTRWQFAPSAATAAAYNTFWNVYATGAAGRMPIAGPTVAFAPLANWVATPTANSLDSLAASLGWAADQSAAASGALYPLDLYADMFRPLPTTGASTLPPAPPSPPRPPSPPPPRPPNPPPNPPAPPAFSAGVYGCLPDGIRCCWDNSCFPSCPPGAANASVLYGCSGELLPNSNRLMDWGQSGYNSGRGGLPNVSGLGVSVASYGAVGNGSSNDTAAFRSAITDLLASAASPKILYIPPGRYTLYGRYDLSGLVLAGSGPESTTLHLASSLEETNGPIVISGGAGNFTFGAAALLTWAAADAPSTSLAGVTAAAAKGDALLHVSGTASLAPGTQARVVLDDSVPGGGLYNDLYGHVQTPANVTRPTSRVIRWTFVVAAVGTGPLGPWIRLSAPLPFNISLAWNPRVFAMGSNARVLQGVENLTVEFPLSTYAYRYEKYNAIRFREVTNAWVRNVVIANADIGLILDRCTAVTATNVTFTTTAPRPSTTTAAGGTPASGTAAVRLVGNQCVLHGIAVRGVFLTDVQISSANAFVTMGNVLSSVTATNLAVTMEMAAYANLITDVNAGQGTRLPPTSTPASLAAFNTYWNVRGSNPDIPSAGFGPVGPGAVVGPTAAFAPLVNWVATPTNNHLNSLAAAGRWSVEAVQAGGAVFPPNLYAAMHAATAGRQPPPTPPPSPPPRPPPPPPAAPVGVYGCLANGSKCCWVGTCTACPPDTANASALWGCTGEASTPSSLSSRLLDWSQVGYRLGYVPPPDLRPLGINVRTFGALGNGIADDTAAFLAALAAPGAAIIYVPSGTYVIRAPMTLDNMFITGDGPGRTILSFPLSMTDVRGPWSGAVSPYSGGSPAFMRWGDSEPTTAAAVVTENATRGATRLFVSSTLNLVLGRQYRLRASDNANNDLLRDLNGDFPGFRTSWLSKVDFARWTSTLVAIGPNYVDFSSPLPFNVSTALGAALFPTKTRLTGVEHMTIQFPSGTSYAFEQEQGYNAIYAFSSVNFLVRNVTFLNADTAIRLTYASQATVTNITFAVTAPRAPPGASQGSGGLLAYGCYQCALRALNFSTIYTMDVVVFGGMQTVVSGVTSIDLRLSLDGNAYGILLSDIDVGNATRWILGRAASSAASLASFNTLWNVRGSRASPLPTLNFAPPRLSAIPGPNFTLGPNMNWVATATNNYMPGGGGLFLEQQGDDGVFPASLDEQMARRAPGLAPAVQAVVDLGVYGCLANGSKCCWDGTCTACPLGTANASSLYGCRGELFAADSRHLSDFSFAGYNGNGSVTPTIPQVANIKTDFGAVGDGVTDDTLAFLTFLATYPSGALYIPPGRYLLTEELAISTPIVLRGAGKDATTLFFNVSLTQLRPAQAAASLAAYGVSAWSYNFGLVSFLAYENLSSGTALANVTAPAWRGATNLSLSDTSRVRVWSEVVVTLDDVAGNLVTYMNGYPAPQSSSTNIRFAMTMIAMVVAKGPNWIVLNRPLNFDIASLAFRPQVHTYAPVLQNCGVEALTIEFPVTPYPGHWQEQGYNGIYFNSVHNSWVKGVRISNSDLGIAVWGSRIVVEDWEQVSAPRGSKVHGHYAINVGYGDDVLVQNFTISARYFHDISFWNRATGNVYREGAATDLVIDFHRGLPSSNLITNLRGGSGNRQGWNLGGGQDQGANSGPWTVIWNVKWAQPVPVPPVSLALDQAGGLGRNQTFVGTSLADVAAPVTGDSSNIWVVETMAAVFPPDLYAGMMLRRTGQVVA